MIYSLSLIFSTKRHFEMVPTQVWMGKYGWTGLLLLPQALTSLPLSLLQGVASSILSSTVVVQVGVT